MEWHKVGVSLYQQNNKAMKTNVTFSSLSSMFQSEASYRTLVDMINEMDLELINVTLS